MRGFRYFQPTDIYFGRGRAQEVGGIVATLGRRCLLVTTPQATSALAPVYDQVSTWLGAAGVEVAHFDQVRPNPTTEIVSAGARLAREHHCDVVLGVGGGSAMDAAKAIAVEATHPGTAWDYLFYRQPQPDARTLPIVTISTTSGTGSQVTQVAVITNETERDKSALYNAVLFPRAAIVDPELMGSVPPRVTAATGFDAFAHSFESFLHPNASPYTDLMALEAIRLVVGALPQALGNGSDLDARERLAWADTLAGLCIAAAGVTLPHGIGMAMGGLFPHIAHGEALAAVYPSVLRYSHGVAGERFAALARALNPASGHSSWTDAAEACESAVDALLRRINLRLTLSDLAVPPASLRQLAKQSLVLPDFRNHPRTATEDDVLDILQHCY